ncbi:SusC/RagA family TonB-linked outer membrane protein [Flavitalea flava]
MKLTAVLLLITCLQLSAREGSAQKINLSERDVPLEKIFKEIRKQTGYQLFYKNELLKNTRKVTVEMKNASIGEVLDYCLKGEGLTYAILDRNIVIKMKEPESLMPALQLPRFTVEGIVTDEKGKAMQNVSVRNKRTKVGCVTNDAGKFSITASAGDILTISFVGYSPRQVKVEEGQTPIQVSMRIGAALLTESVIVGYGSQERRSLLGAVGTYKPANEIGALPLSIDNALVGKIAGVLVTPSSGVPGSATSITIRGVSTLNTTGNAPLIVVDEVPIYGIDRTNNTADFGVGNIAGFAFGGNQTAQDYDVSGQLRNQFEKNPLATINPDDIESIEVLKDAFSTAIYGSRGAAGVILITTKKGHEGIMNVTADLATSLSVQKLPKLMNGDQYAGFYTAYFHTMDSINAIGNPFYWAQNYVFPKGVNTNWLKEVTRQALSTNATLALSGGNGKGSYYVSGNYTRQQSTIINNDYTRYQMRVRFDQHLSKIFTVGTDMNLTYTNNNALNAQTVYRGAINKSPNQAINNPDGSYNWGKGTNPIGPTADLNPVGTANTYKNYSPDSRVMGNVYGDLKLTPWLTFRSEFGVDWLNGKAYSRDIVKPQTPGGFGNETNTQYHKWVTNNTLTINKNFGSKHNINGVVGQSFEGSTESSSSIWGRNFLNNDILSISAASQKGVQSALEKKWGLVSYFSRMTYAYDQKYMFGVTYRLDGSSKFAANRRYVGFPSFSLGWAVNRESFLKNVATIDQLKLRSSIGFSGTDGGGGYYGNQGQYTLNVYGATYGNGTVLNVSQPANPNLIWEKTKTYNLGLDISLWQSRLTFTFDYYNKQINNAILPSAVPGFLGFTSQTQNLADLNNRGLEFTINSRNVHSLDFQWTTNFNIARNRNIIQKLHKIDPTDLAQQIEQNGGRYWLEGHSATEFFLFQWAGVNPQNGNPLWQSTNGKTTETPFPANYSDPNYLTQRVAQGDAMPTWYGGLDNTFSYRGWELDAFFSFAFGHKMYNGAKANLYNYTQSTYSNAQINNLSPDLLNYWTAVGQQTNIPALINASNNANASFGSSYDYTLGRDISRFLEDASFVKLRYVTLAYNVSRSTIKRAKYFSSLKIYVQANNVLTITKYSGLDPEVSAYGSSSLNAGYDELTMAAPRTFTAGIKLGL